ncbi:MAG: quinone-dependent dihydroorotate dehydrogenase [Burkholderiaceae bacterium]|nr:quinone-dependent dihydroorotate dehydrogenase [Burkholderiaceae bacterium]
MDPEAAHEFTFKSLERMRQVGLLPPSRPLPGQAVRALGLSFTNPIGLAAGLDKNAAHLDALGSFGFGFIEVGTVTPRGQPGNPKPRMFRLPEHQALINRLGFNNLGLQAFLTNVRFSQWAQEKRGILGLNIGKNADTPMDRADDDYLICLEGVYPWADYITVNISSPNTKNLRELQQEDALDRLLGKLKTKQQQLAAQTQRHVPLVLKIAPDLDDEQIDAIAKTLQRHQIEGVIATNTTLDRQTVAGHAFATEQGGLSGAPLLSRSNHVIRVLRAALGPDTTIIGVGGVLSADDALSKLQSGADLVQLYTGLIYRGPALVAESVRATRSA